jgi:hypothetical protein
MSAYDVIVLAGLCISVPVIAFMAILALILGIRLIVDIVKYGF